MRFSRNLLIIIAVILLGLTFFGFWFFQESSKLYVGTKTEDLGRNHVSLGTKVDYKTNPPTSGNHYEIWTKAGVYDTLLDDRNLVHSLEHGYVIISYNCGFGQSQAEASASASLPASFSSDECKKLVEQLTKIYEDKGKRKLIVVPRPSLDALIALTAWDRLDKFNPFDKDRIEKFIDALRDRGPEKTMEP